MKKSGPTPFGFVRSGGRLRRNKHEAQTRQRVFELFSIHKKKSMVAEALNALGHRTRSRTIFSAQTVTRMLADPVVLGIPGEIDQIVKPELYQCCQDILSEQKAAGGANRSPRHLFAGLLFCSCGQKMYVPSSSKKYVCSDCRSKVLATDLETVFVKQAQNQLSELSKSPVSSLLDDWRVLIFVTKREIVEALCERIEVNDKSITIHFADL